MLALLINAGSEVYAVDARDVVEVVPFATLRSVPQAPPHIRGILNLRREPVPVIDLCRLVSERFCDDAHGSRIALLHYPSREKPEHILGLLAERVTETRRIEERDLKSTGIMIRNAKYLGRVIADGPRMIQWLHIAQLVPDELKQLLFTEAAGSVEAPA